ncbi:AraC family transcriptional regulator [Stutzerimonas tarimensis]|uniref:AraC family transcriptional regulator n=1 Tax=Stutzerimonas tarimensis TaxID=1507735 RepID=A0ABV7T7Y8_9GAMM
MTAMQSLTAAGLDLSGLCREPVFTSRCRAESHQLLARELVEHDLSWRQGAVDTAFFRAAIGRCDLFVLRYGAEVEVRPQPFNDFVLMQLPLRGSASLLCDGVALEARPGQLSVLAPRHEARLVWRRGCEQLLVKVPRSLLQPARARLLDEGALTADVDLPPLFQLEGRQGARGLRLLGELLDQLPGTGDEENPLWRRHLEESLSMFLLTHQPAMPRVGKGPVVSRSLAERQLRRQVDKVETVIQAQLTAAVSLRELAAACGMSVRSLSNLCQRCHGQSPMERLRNLRLDAARERLLASRDLSVTEVALDYGFTHLGRFAGYYRERFGELPRET